MDEAPYCCGKPSTLNVVSPRLQFWVCKECKNEVKEIDFSDVYYYTGYQDHKYGYIMPSGDD